MDTPNAENETDDFLGRAWVPLSLAVVAGVVVAFLAMGRPAVGFLVAATVVAFSIALRLTWDRRSDRRYGPIVSGFFIAHVCFVALFGGHFGRAAGGLYMSGGLLDAALMTFIIRAATKANVRE